MKKGFSAIFWDNDGVLMETEHLYFQANAEALARVGCELSLEAFVRVSLQAGASLLAGCSPDEAGLRSWRDRRYAELLPAAQPVPGAPELLRELHGRLPMAIVTSCRREHFWRMHAGRGMTDCVDFVLTREDYQQSKPHPEPYLLACRRAGVHPETALAIEDSPRGVVAARAAGLTVVALPGRLNAGHDYSAAWQRIEHLDQLRDLLAVS